MKSERASTSLRACLRWSPLLALLVALPGLAQYKVVGADGKVTYTDQAPKVGAGTVTSLGLRTGGTASIDVSLPLELRQPVAKYPVTLYTMTGACDACESARRMLRQRGVPFTEKQVQTTDDSEALERLTGGRDVPTLSIGTQTLRGLALEVWNSYLDAAGYPRESRLAANYQNPPVAPIVERREANAAPAPTRAAARAAAAEPTASGTVGGIKF